MADDPTASEETQGSATHLTFNVKSSSDAKHVVTVPDTMSVLELKQKLSTSEYADVPAERQRLIYSGRVLKDADPLSNYKIKDGNTIHLVKSAASSIQSQQQPQAASQTSSSPSGNNPSAQSNPAASGVPQNLAAGTGNDPLAGLTGARYAGFAQMPNASTFGADGGMNPAQNPEEFMQMLENPMFQSQMNEAMNNPDVIRMMQNLPQFRNNPMLRQMLENPEFRRMMTDPQFIRQSLQMSRLMGGGAGPFGGGGAGAGGMPAPGVTDNTPQQGGTGGQDQARSAAGATEQQGQQQQQGSGMTGFGAGGAGANPFGAFGMGAGGAGGSQANPFAQLFGGAGGNPFANPFAAAGSPTSNTDSNATQADPNANPQQQQQPNLFAPFNLQQLAELDARVREDMNQQNTGGQQLPSWLQAMNEAMQSPQQQQQQQQQQQDTRPPEEQYESQLRQLNDMGFFEFDRNVRALRMSGGNVQGAIEYLLNDS